MAQAVKCKGHAADIALQPIVIYRAGSTPICYTRRAAGGTIAPAAADGDFAEWVIILNHQIFIRSVAQYFDRAQFEGLGKNTL